MHTIEIPGVRIAIEQDGDPITSLHTAARGRYCNEPTHVPAYALDGIANTFIRLAKALRIGSVWTPARAIAGPRDAVAKRFFDGAVFAFRDKY